MTHSLINGGFLVLTRANGTVMAVRPETVVWVEGGAGFCTVYLDDPDRTTVDCINLMGDVLSAIAKLEEEIEECD